MGLVERPAAIAAGTGVGGAAETRRLPSRVGAPLEEARSRLISVAERLEPHLDPHALPIVTEARRVLQEQTCRIAVIGQIKAGKSSFINGLTQIHDLLPTDINPWTAVVTSLHMRNDRPPPPHAAVFKLFSREEWQRLAEGGGRLRELTERLVPGFEPELLKAQIQVMRQRVESRLGPRLEELLGQTHSFERITPDILDDYVSAGTYLGGQPPANGRMQFSDVTRTADLYLSGGPFAFPVTLVDTPGTNDPFLVRDEITRRSLESSDIYVFVISALQPLSSTDIALLRILNGLHKDRIVVFVNRIDQLRNPLTDAKAVKDSVKSRLEREFPALDIPVVVGSARWACLGLTAKDRDVAKLIAPAALPYLKEFGLAAALELSAAQPLSVEHRNRLAAALYDASGLPGVAASIAGLLSSGSTAVLLRQLAACFLELARATEVTAKLDLQSLMDLVENQRAETRAISERIEMERKALAQLDEPIRQIQRSFGLIERQLGDILRTDVGNLRADLEAIVERFASEECADMMLSIRRRDHDGEWRADLRPLRQDLETHYVEAYQSTEARLIEIERVLYPQLKTIVDAIVPGSGIDVADDYAVPSNPYPSIAPLSDVAVMDLDVPWWKYWFAARPDASERAADLRRIIEQDFMPLTEHLAEQANRELSSRITRTLQQAHAVSTGMLTAIQGRKAQVLADYEALNNPKDGRGPGEIEADQRARYEGCKKRHAASVGLVEELTRLSAYCQQAFNVEGRA